MCVFAQPTVSGVKYMSGLKELITIASEFLGVDNFITLVFVLVAGLGYWVSHYLLLPFFNRVMHRTRTEWDDILIKRGVFRQLSYFVPALILYFGVAFLPLFSEDIWKSIILVYIILNAIIIQDRLLSAGLDIYRLYPFSKTHPIKPYIQLVRLLVYVIGLVSLIAVILGKSPWGLIAGIGTAATILMVVFRNSILSLIAGIQLVANDLVRRGDWIEVPECGADGDVIDITTQTVKVQNFDKTIVTIPTYKLLDDSFRNWRGMRDTNGRRIKRSLLIDQTSVCFCDDDMLEEFGRIHLLGPYLSKKREAIERANAGLGDDEQLALNGRRLTNLGTFRAYVEAYLVENSKLRDDLIVMVRQLPPTAEGLPLEVYSFASDIDWVSYECLQSDIFDHLLASVPFFGLRVFQNPSGHDLSALRGVR